MLIFALPRRIKEWLGYPASRQAEVASTVDSILQQLLLNQTHRPWITLSLFTGNAVNNCVLSFRITDKYNTFINQLVTVFASKCEEELASTKLLLWEAKFSGLVPGSEDKTATAKDLATAAFASMKQLLSQNVMLKCYFTFLEYASLLKYLMSLRQPHLWGELQSSITMELNDDLLAELFEVSAEQKKLAAEAAELASIKELLEKQDSVVNQAVSVLTRK